MLNFIMIDVASLLPWGQPSQYPGVVVTPKVHDRLIKWFTSGFL